MWPLMLHLETLSELYVFRMDSSEAHVGHRVQLEHVSLTRQARGVCRMTDLCRREESAQSRDMVLSKEVEFQQRSHDPNDSISLQWTHSDTHNVSQVMMSMSILVSMSYVPASGQSQAGGSLPVPSELIRIWPTPQTCDLTCHHVSDLSPRFLS